MCNKIDVTVLFGLFDDSPAYLPDLLISPVMCNGCHYNVVINSKYCVSFDWVDFLDEEFASVGTSLVSLEKLLELLYASYMARL